MRDSLSQTFSALADPTRRAILARLAEGQANVTELAEPFLEHMSLPAVTKHLKVLENAGLITKGQDAQRRPCELNADRLQAASDWMDQYRTFWEESLDRLGDYLKTVTAKDSNKPSRPKRQNKKTTPVKGSTKEKVTMPSSNQSKDIRITRVYDAPVSIVWDAWTDPEQVAKWWGPRGFTLTTHSKDLRPGGIWHYTMHGPDGTDYPNKTLYHEVVEQQKLVYDHGGYDERDPLFRVTALFAETDGKTVLEMTMTLKSPEEATAMRKFIKDAGGNSTWDRLAEYLDDRLQGRGCFVINYSIPAARADVFKMWTEVEHLCRWLPPQGFDMQILSGEIATGKSAFYKMASEKFTMYGRCEYREIVPNSRIVYVQSFCDEAGNLARHPGAPNWPAQMLTTVLFADEKDSYTRITLTSIPWGDTSAEEQKTFVEGRGSMTKGFSNSFDKLDELLAMKPLEK